MTTWLIQTLVRFIARCVPKRGKRVVYAVLCYTVFSSNKDDQQAEVDMMEINKRLNLVDDKRSLRFVLQIRDLLLSSPDLSHLKTETKEGLISKIPYWLHYAPESNMRQDLSIIMNPRFVQYA